MMKKISLPTDLLVALAQLEDKDLALLLRAIINYANEGIAPSFSNAALKAFFSLFRSVIDEQRSSSEKQCVINRDNAKGKKCNMKKKDSKDNKCVSSSFQSSNDSTDTASESESLPFASTMSESLSLDAIEAVYPKLGSFRDESLAIWNQLSADSRQRAIDFIPSYLTFHPSTADQYYLNQYLKAEPWEK